MAKGDRGAVPTCEPEGVPVRDADERPWSRLPELTLAACAGASDLLAVLTHEGAFASVVTGKVALVGAEAVTGDERALLTPATAVTGFVIGVAVWHALWRSRAQALVGMLATELVLLVGYAAVWLATRGAPSVVGGTAMLMVIAIAMGGQSVASTHMRAYTTYLTGALTAAVQDFVARAPERRMSGLRQLAAFVAGASAAALALRYLRWWAPLLPVLLLTVALGGIVRALRRVR